MYFLFKGCIFSSSCAVPVTLKLFFFRQRFLTLCVMQRVKSANWKKFFVIWTEIEMVVLMCKTFSAGHISSVGFCSVSILVCTTSDLPAKSRSLSSGPYYSIITTPLCVSLSMPLNVRHSVAHLISFQEFHSTVLGLILLCSRWGLTIPIVSIYLNFR